MKKGQHQTEQSKQKIRENAKTNLNYGMKNKKHSEETKERQRQASLGHITTKETKEKLRESALNRLPYTKESKEKMRQSALSRPPHTDETREKIRQSKLGKTHSKERNEKNRQAHLGNKNGNWQGGKSFEPYSINWTEDVRYAIRKRDNFTCQECKHTEKQLGYNLSIHHVDYNKKNNKENNLISLCKSCHSQTNFKRKDWTKYFRSKCVV